MLLRELVPLSYHLTLLTCSEEELVDLGNSNGASALTRRIKGYLQRVLILNHSLSPNLPAITFSVRA